jgi:hypothetical protein
MAFVHGEATINHITIVVPEMMADLEKNQTNFEQLWKKLQRNSKCSKTLRHPLLCVL